MGGRRERGIVERNRGDEYTRRIYGEDAQEATRWQKATHPKDTQEAPITALVDRRNPYNHCLGNICISATVPSRHEVECLQSPAVPYEPEGRLEG